MKAITLHQPWASLIAHHIKVNETRPWAPPENLIGRRIAIHAAKRKPDTEFEEIKGYQLPLGAIVAVATLRFAFQSYGIQTPLGEKHGLVIYDIDEVRGGCFRTTVSDDYGDYSYGRWIWGLTGVIRIRQPVAARGFQKFWTVPEKTVAALRKQTYWVE